MSSDPQASFPRPFRREHGVKYDDDETISLPRAGRYRSFGVFKNMLRYRSEPRSDLIKQKVHHYRAHKEMGVLTYLPAHRREGM